MEHRFAHAATEPHLMPKLRKILSLIDEPESEDTSLDFNSLPPIAKGELELVCGSCGSMLGECVATRDLYVAAAALLRNRMPVRLILTCAGCGKYNLITPPLAD
jgi:hypothetical protein